MKRIVRLTESDLARIVRRVINEKAPTPSPAKKQIPSVNLANITIDGQPETWTLFFTYEPTTDRVKGFGYVSNGKQLKPAYSTNMNKDSLIFLRNNIFSFNGVSKINPYSRIDVDAKLSELATLVQQYKQPTQNPN